jgi:hypothetical protein
MKLLPMEWIGHVDRELYYLCEKDGMSKLRLWWVRLALDNLEFYADPKSRKKIYTAP